MKTPERNEKTTAALAPVTWLGRLPSVIVGINRMVWAGRYLLALRVLRNELLILCHQFLYCFYLCRKRAVLTYSSLRVRFRLFHAERQLVAKYGRNWRIGVLNYEQVQALKSFEYIHKRLMKKSSSSNGSRNMVMGLSNAGTQRPGSQDAESANPDAQPGSLK